MNVNITLFDITNRKVFPFRHTYITLTHCFYSVSTNNFMLKSPDR